MMFFNCVSCIASSGRMNVSEKLRRIFEEAVISSFGVLSQHFALRDGGKP